MSRAARFSLLSLFSLLSVLSLVGCRRATTEVEPPHVAAPPGHAAGPQRVAPAPSPDAAMEDPMAETLPPDVLLQVRHASGWADRLLLDGRYLRADDGRTFAPAAAWPIRATPTPSTLSPGALGRVRDALAAVDFARLPARLPSTVPPGAALPPRGAPPRLERWIFTARVDGVVRSVEVSADPRLPSSFEALAPLYQVLDGEIWGNYRHE